MPRKARIDAPGALHHVIVRGIERGKIFRSDYDRKNFLNRLGKLIPETQTDCFAWALIAQFILNEKKELDSYVKHMRAKQNHVS